MPVNLTSKKIALTFWGKAWCDHMDSFHDYENRLAKGRTYVRNGSVCHLAIEPGAIKAYVSGSEIYTVHISMRLLDKLHWQNMQQVCRGQISSLLDLLGGRLSPEVMQIVCDPRRGLFPSAEDVELSCTCPDWATMCKHIAAVLYGVGARLDNAPSELFKLRGVDHTALVDVVKTITDVAQTSTSRRRLTGNHLSELFDIEMKAQPLEPEKPSKPSKAAASSKSLKVKPIAKKPIVTSPQATLPPKLPNYSGSKIKKIRQRLQQTQVAFAKTIGVSASTVSKWEAHGAKRVRLQAKQIAALERLKMR